MKARDKRHFIHSHLHQLDEAMVDEIFEKVSSVVSGRRFAQYVPSVSNNKSQKQTICNI